MSKSKPKIVAKYKGSGFLNGVPARDLTAVDWHNLNEEKKAVVISAADMYDVTLPKADKPKGD